MAGLAKREWLYCTACREFRWHRLVQTKYAWRYVCEACGAAVEVDE